MKSFYAWPNNYAWPNKKTAGVIHLHPFSRKYLSEIPETNYFDWFNDLVVTAYNSHGLLPQTTKDTEEFLDSLETDKSKIVFAITLNDQLHIGNASLQRIDWINRSAEFAIVIGESQYHDFGIGSEVLGHVLHHAFRKLNLNRVWTGTAETNVGMRRTAEKNKMVSEGVMREGIFLNGEYVDICQYGILKSEWEQNNK